MEKSESSLDGLPGFFKSQGLELLAKIASGGMADVYKARNLMLDRLVAVKILKTEHALDEKFIKRFKNEARLASSLSHPNVVQILSFGVFENGSPYLVMEYIEGHCLSETLEREAPLHKERFAQIFLPLMEALEYAHKRKIIHKDLKPQNIMLAKLPDESEQCKILDFGIAGALDSGANDNNAAKTNKGTAGFAGSPLYMSPEQVSSQALDERSDIYSLACIMYEALVGKPPFKGETALETMYDHLNKNLPALETISGRQEIPEALVLSIMQALSKNPLMRQQSMKEFKEQVADGLDSKILRSRSKSKSKIWLALLTACSLLFSAMLLNELTKSRKNNAPAQLNLADRSKKPFKAGTGLPSIIKSSQDLLHSCDTPSKEESAKAVAELSRALNSTRIRSEASSDQLNDAYMLLGDLLAKQGMLKEAESSYRQAVRAVSSPSSAKHIFAVIQIAEMQKSQGKTSDSLATYKDAVKRADEDLSGQKCSRFVGELCFKYAEDLLNLNREDEAVEILKECLRHYDGSPYKRRELRAVGASWRLAGIYFLRKKDSLARIEIDTCKRDLETPYKNQLEEQFKGMSDSKDLRYSMIDFADLARKYGQIEDAVYMYKKVLAKTSQKRDPVTLHLKQRAEAALAQLANESRKALLKP